MVLNDVAFTNEGDVWTFERVGYACPFGRECINCPFYKQNSTEDFCFLKNWKINTLSEERMQELLSSF